MKLFCNFALSIIRIMNISIIVGIVVILSFVIRRTLVLAMPVREYNYANSPPSCKIVFVNLSETIVIV